MTIVNRPELSSSRPDGAAIDEEGPYIGAHYRNKPGCQDAAMTESFVNVLTGDYHLTCNNCGDVVYE